MAGGTDMSDDKTPSADSFADRIGRVLPYIFVIGLLVMSMISNPLFSGRAAEDAKSYTVYMVVGILGLLFHLVTMRQQQRIAQLEQRLSELTDLTHPPR
jgi:hypothetical protein